MSHKKQQLNQRVAGVPSKQDSAVDSVFVPVDLECLRYLSLYKEDELQKIQKEDNVTISHRANGYDVKGSTIDSTWAANRVNRLVEEVKCSTFSFVTWVDVGKFAKTAATTGKKYGCHIGHKVSTKPASRQRAQSAIQFTQEQQDVKVRVVFNRIEKQKTTESEFRRTRCVQESDGSGWHVLSRAYHDGIGYGDLAVTSSGNLDTCKKIYHGCLPFYTGHMETFTLSQCYECLVFLVFRCLIQASKDEFETIALPAFGTGALQYPAKDVIQLLYTAIDLFTQNNRQTSLKEIFIVNTVESRLDVKQLFLAHGITHKLNTRWLEAPPEDQRGFFYRLFWPRTNDIMAEFFEREVRRPGQNNCEVRVMIGYTLVQIINGGINEVCNATDTGLLLWRLQDQFGRRPVTGGTVTAHKTCIRVDCTDDSEEIMAMGLRRGLRRAAEKEWYHVTVPLAATDIISPDHISAAIVSALRSVSSVYVLTIVVSDTSCYIDLVTRIAQHGTVQTPPSVTNSLAEYLWKTKFSRQRSDSLGTIHAPAVDIVMFVTSDSEETNRNAAEDVERELHVPLQDVLQFHNSQTRE